MENQDQVQNIEGAVEVEAVEEIDVGDSTVLVWSIEIDDIEYDDFFKEMCNFSDDLASQLALSFFTFVDFWHVKLDMDASTFESKIIPMFDKAFLSYKVYFEKKVYVKE